MFNITEIGFGYTSPSKTIEATTFAAAVEIVKVSYPVVHIEQDGDDAANFITKFGSVYSIERA